MKKIFLLGGFLLCMSSFGAMAQTSPGSSTPASSSTGKSEFKFSQESHDFGTLQEGAPASFDFKFTNTGTEPLVITNAVASCGCTTPKWPKEPIPKGGSGVIAVSYATTGRPGTFNKTITITSNAKTPTKILTIKGTVQAGKK